MDYVGNVPAILKSMLCRLKLKMCIFTLLVSIFLSACTAYKDKSNYIVLEQDRYSNYKSALERVYTDVDFISRKQRTDELIEGASIESYEQSAKTLISSTALNEESWREDYLATVVIVLDRAKTKLPIKGFRDLRDIEEKVSLNPEYIDYISAAAAWGLSGNQEDYKEFFSILDNLNRRGMLLIQEEPAAIWIGFDYQALSYREAAHDIDIVMPVEGSLSFKKGLLSLSGIDRTKDKELKEHLLAEGFRLTDGTYSYQLDIGSYEHAALAAELNLKFSKTYTDFLRQIRKTRLYEPANGIEEMMLALVYIALVVFWMGSLHKRAMRKSIKNAAFLVACILIFWGMVRLMKHQIIEENYWTRIFWFSYYIGMLLPTSIIMKLARDIEEDESITKRWDPANILLIIDIISLILVFSNDAHQLIFSYNLNIAGWSKNYSYGILYYVIYAYIFIKAFFVMFMMIQANMYKSKNHDVVYPVAMLIVIFVYGIAYVNRVPVIYDTDVGIVMASFTLIVLEMCLSLGILPINVNYDDIIKHSSLNIRIEDDEHSLLLGSGRLEAECEGLISRSREIIGGHIYWYDDISKVNSLKADLLSMSSRLRISNALLEEKYKVDRLERVRLRRELLENMEAEIKPKLKKMVDIMEDVREHSKPDTAMSEIIILLCYIKRRLNLFFRQKDADTISADEISAYIKELCDLAAYSKSKIAFVSDLEQAVNIEYVIVIYDFCYRLLEYSVQKATSMLVRLSNYEKACYISAMLSGYALDLEINNQLKNKLDEVSAVLDMEEQDGICNISLSIPASHT